MATFFTFICPAVFSIYLPGGQAKLHGFFHVLRRRRSAKTARMDMDVVKGKNAQDTIIQQFEQKRINILVGTQLMEQVSGRAGRKEKQGLVLIQLRNTTHPGITALFFQGCCGDINPNPRGVLQNAEQHGRSLAEAVQHVLSGDMKPVSGSIRREYMTVDLDFQPFALEAYQKDMITGDQFVQRRAKLMLQRHTTKAGM